MKTENQTGLIKKYLESGNSITPLEALNLFGCLRLGARIYDLKCNGMNIISKTVTIDGKHYAKYSIE